MCFCVGSASPVPAAFLLVSVAHREVDRKEVR